MKGTLMQLIAIGVEDIYLNVNPEITYFRAVYKRHTNFSIESIEQILPNTPKFNSTCKVLISRKGDLLSRAYLETTLPHDSTSNSVWTNRVGFNLIKKVELIIGNQIVDRHYGLWMYIWSELSNKKEKKNILDELVGKTSNGGTASNGIPVKKINKLTIPLFFTFCKDSSSFLPISAITKQNIYIKFYFEEKKNCIQSGTLPKGDLSDTQLFIDYIFLEKNEKMKISQNKYEYVINVVERFQRQLNNNGLNLISLPFFNSIKEIIWVVKRNLTNDNTDKFTDFTDGQNNSMIKKAQILINSKKLFSSGFRKFYYFNYINPYQFHTGIPNLGINSISFCLEPEESSPTGNIKINKNDKLSIKLDSSIGVLNVFSLSYNILTINNGFANLKNKY